VRARLSRPLEYQVGALLGDRSVMVERYASTVQTALRLRHRGVTPR
jgi:hypothetical protein